MMSRTTRTDYLTNTTAKQLMINYEKKKTARLQEPGWFPIFSEFRDTGLLRDISGNALKLYIYLGIISRTISGECWPSLRQIGEYFGKSERTISTWMDELRRFGLIERIQPDYTSSSVTFLKLNYIETDNSKEKKG